MFVILFHFCTLWLYDVAKGGEKNGYFRNQEHNLNLSMNSKRKGEKIEQILHEFS